MWGFVGILVRQRALYRAVCRLRGDGSCCAPGAGWDAGSVNRLVGAVGVLCDGGRGARLALRCGRLVPSTSRDDLPGRTRPVIRSGSQGYGAMGPWTGRRESRKRPDRRNTVRASPAPGCVHGRSECARWPAVGSALHVLPSPVIGRIAHDRAGGGGHRRLMAGHRGLVAVASHPRSRRATANPWSDAQVADLRGGICPLGDRVGGAEMAFLRGMQPAERGGRPIGNRTGDACTR